MANGPSMSTASQSPHVSYGATAHRHAILSFLISGRVILSPPEPAQFAEPWEAQALALANELVRVGRFTASEWAHALGEAIQRAEQTVGPDDGSSYYRHVLSAV